VCPWLILYNSSWLSSYSSGLVDDSTRLKALSLYENCLAVPNVLLVFGLQPVYNADFVIPVEIDGTVHQVSLLLCRCLLSY